VWLLAIAGIIMKFTCISKMKKVSSFIYIGMGWLCIFAGREMLASLSKETLTYLVAGGLFYSFGVIFYSWDKLKFNHAIWHLFVLAGSLFHFFAVFEGLFHSVII
jgi:hemolysin III